MSDAPDEQKAQDGTTPAPTPSPSPASAGTPAGIEIKAPVTGEMVMEAIKPVVDPEIHLSIVDLGLVYGADVDPEGKQVTVRLTLTSPACPYGPLLIDQVKLVAGSLPGVEKADVQVVWDPPWDPRTMASEYAKDVLGIW